MLRRTNISASSQASDPLSARRKIDLRKENATPASGLIFSTEHAHLSAWEHALNGLKILLISITCMLAGAFSLCLVVGGVDAAPCALLFVAFGWCFLIPVYLLVGFNWLLFLRRFARMPWDLSFVVFGAIFGAGVLALVAPEASSRPIYLGTILAGAVAGAVANSLIVMMKNQSGSYGAR
jgi:hypothetical protein